MPKRKRITKDTPPVEREPLLKGLPEAPVRPLAAVVFARNEAQSGRTDFLRLCLKFVRLSYSLPPVYPSARVAWQSAKRKHKWTGDVEDIPFGAPVFSKGPNDGPNDAWHVFLACGRDKSGVRIFRSNDILVKGGISTVRIEAFTERWGHTILGWTEDLNGFDLNLPPSPNERKAAKRK